MDLIKKGAYFFSFREDPFKTGNTNFDRVTSPESIIVPLLEAVYKQIIDIRLFPWKKTKKSSRKFAEL